MRKKHRIVLLVFGVIVIVLIHMLVLTHEETSTRLTSGGDERTSADIMQKGESGVPSEIPDVYEDVEDHDPPGELKD